MKKIALFSLLILLCATANGLQAAGTEEEAKHQSDECIVGGVAIERCTLGFARADVKVAVVRQVGKPPFEDSKLDEFRHVKVCDKETDEVVLNLPYNRAIGVYALNDDGRSWSGTPIYPIMLPNHFKTADESGNILRVATLTPEGEFDSVFQYDKNGFHQVELPA